MGIWENTHFFVAGFSATMVKAHVNKSGLSPPLSSPNFLTSIDISMLDLPTYDTNPKSFKSQKWLRGEMMEILSTAAVTTVGPGPVCYLGGRGLRLLVVELSRERERGRQGERYTL